MSFVNHSFTRRLARRFLGSKGMRLRGVYLMQVEEELQGFFFGDEEKLSA